MEKGERESRLDDLEANTRELQLAPTQMEAVDPKTPKCNTCENTQYHKGWHSTECGARILPETVPDTYGQRRSHRRCACWIGKGSDAKRQRREQERPVQQEPSSRSGVKRALGCCCFPTSFCWVALLFSSLLLCCVAVRRKLTLWMCMLEEEEKHHHPNGGGEEAGRPSISWREEAPQRHPKGEEERTTGKSSTTRKGRGRKAPPPKGRGNTTTAHEEEGEPCTTTKEAGKAAPPTKRKRAHKRLDGCCLLSLLPNL